METAPKVEKMMGRSAENQVLQDGTNSRTEMNLMNGDRIRTMPDDEGLLIFKNEEPIKLQTVPYFRNRKLRRQSKFSVAPDTGTTAQHWQDRL